MIILIIIIKQNNNNTRILHLPLYFLPIFSFFVKIFLFSSLLLSVSDVPPCVICLTSARNCLPLKDFTLATFLPEIRLKNVHFYTAKRLLNKVIE